MDDDQIRERGGDDRDIEEYAKQNGADLTEDDVRYPFDLDPARILPYSQEIGENPYGRAIEGTYNEPYMS